MKILQAHFLVIFLVCTFYFDGSVLGWGGSKSEDLDQFKSQLLNEMQNFKDEKDLEISELKNKIQGRNQTDQNLVGLSKKGIW